MMNKESVYSSSQTEFDTQEREDADNDTDIVQPFPTKDVRVIHATIAMSSIINRLTHDEIDLKPDFQRNLDLWDPGKMSRLIESILLRLPLPVFYFDVSNPDKWIIVDGLQRLSTIKKFVVEKKLKLKNMEFLTDLNGKGFKDLDRSLQRIIDETQVVTYQIEAQTPKEVRYSIFNRINTGGLTLNAQEIRQALNQTGKGLDRLKEICENVVFKKVVAIKSKRMADKELALRFIALKLVYKDYIPLQRMEDLLDKTMEYIDTTMKDEDFDTIKQELFESLKFSEKIFGENHHFSRSIGLEDQNNTLNKSLFDIITICFSEIKDKEAFLEKKDTFVSNFKEYLCDKNGVFSQAITAGTNGRMAIESRFEIMRQLIKEACE